MLEAFGVPYNCHQLVGFGPRVMEKSGCEEKKKIFLDLFWTLPWRGYGGLCPARGSRWKVIGSSIPNDHWDKII
jgi:hypothetical protein